MYENPNDDLYFGEVYRTVLQEAWLPEGGEVWQRTGKSRRGRRPTQQGIFAGSPTDAQAAIRQCFQKCVAAWQEVPWDRDPIDPCTQRLVKTEWYELTQDAGVPCGYYDYFIRHCQKACIETGCIPANTYCIEWDPANVEFIPMDDSRPVSVLGGVLPLKWSISGNGFSLLFDETPTLANTVITTPTACGTAVINVVDACGRTCSGEVLSEDGRWCTCYSHATGGSPNVCGDGEFSINIRGLKFSGLCATNGGYFSVTFDCEVACDDWPPSRIFPPPDICGGTQEACDEDGEAACCRYWNLKIERWVCPE